MERQFGKLGYQILTDTAGSVQHGKVCVATGIWVVGGLADLFSAG